MTMPTNHKAELWWQLMEQARIAAAQVRSQDLRLQLLVNAACYKVLALRAEREAKAAPAVQKEDEN